MLLENKCYFGICQQYQIQTKRWLERAKVQKRKRKEKKPTISLEIFFPIFCLLVICLQNFNAQCENATQMANICYTPSLPTLLCSIIYVS